MTNMLNIGLVSSLPATPISKYLWFSYKLAILRISILLMINGMQGDVKNINEDVKDVAKGC